MSTQFPDPSSSSSPTTPPAGLPGDGRPPRDPRGDRPVGRGERRAWNTATAVIGGVTALGLLLAGAGTAAAVALTQERDGSWTATSAVKEIRIDTRTATVDVTTSPTVEHVEVQWHETGWSLPDRQITPTVENGVLSLDAVRQEESAWATGPQQISVVVPQDAPAASLDISSTAGAVNVQGTYQDVSASSEMGSVTATDVKASVLDARATTGQVVLDGVSVKNRLDAHVTLGMALVAAQGPAPQRTSVTATTGAYGVDMPGADYWYPQSSQQDIADPRHPRTTTPGSSAYAGDSWGSGDSWSSDEGLQTATQGGAPSTEYDADATCDAAPKGRPCLFLKGTPVDVRDAGTVDSWDGDSQEPTDGSPSSLSSPRSSNSPAPSPTVSTAPGRDE
ncbi:DUF4097 family beta strand repeat-containing protein [Kocuria rhizophila]|uniref:DUF4097 family beta strand repeat-containing protein n=2 Tax=Kocuria rhizophila TaxID=72000 RepID=UPI001CB8E55E|nr:DUF4097 family beta strand repeat-containing protein [Kocuria rhizophila]MCT1957150.1 DUF4097 domain-containing protein [Kocuria rhizophila]MCT2074640.1 DUF4097 domain-containing protein [Kocuria rhizophila]WSY88136.1 DUF4097 domain-containing protein [Kocuria rhizophila]WSZ53562.1 DUF4097 domain-containing protein [Kocuria rhizophila]